MIIHPSVPIPDKELPFPINLVRKIREEIIEVMSEIDMVIKPEEIIFTLAGPGMDSCPTAKFLQVEFPGYDLAPVFRRIRYDVRSVTNYQTAHELAERIIEQQTMLHNEREYHMDSLNESRDYYGRLIQGVGPKTIKVIDYGSYGHGPDSLLTTGLDEAGIRCLRLIQRDDETPFSSSVLELATHHRDHLETMLPVNREDPLVNPLYGVHLIKHHNHNDALIILQHAVDRVGQSKIINDSPLETNKLIAGVVDGTFYMDDIFVSPQAIALSGISISESISAGLIGQKLTKLIEIKPATLIAEATITAIENDEYDAIRFFHTHISMPFSEVLAAIKRATSD